MKFYGKDGTMRGGARPGSGPKRKALTEKISAGKAATVIDLPAASELVGVEMPTVKDYMKAAQKNGDDLCAEEIFRETWEWLAKVGCTEHVNIQLVNQYAMSVARQMQLVPLSKLVPYVNNARTHSPEQITKLRSSLREFGFIKPVIIDSDYGIIAGHGRVLAAKEEGIEEVPCVLVDYLTEAQKKAYILADNRFVQDAGWDEELLRIEIESLQGADFDVSLTGFEDEEIADLFAGDKDNNAQDDDFDLSAALPNNSNFLF